jgi:hypothetical protein
MPDLAHEALSVVLFPSGTAGRLDVPGFAGVCPMASPDPVATKFQFSGVAKRTAIHSA